MEDLQVCVELLLKHALDFGGTHYAELLHGFRTRQLAVASGERQMIQHFLEETRPRRRYQHLVPHEAQDRRSQGGGTVEETVLAGNEKGPVRPSRRRVEMPCREREPPLIHS